MTILIKGGTVISSTGADLAEVLVDGETIVAVLRPGCAPAGLLPVLAQKSFPEP